MKKPSLIILMLLLLLNIASAASSDYNIEKVAVNGNFLDNETVALQRGAHVQIDVWLKGIGTTKDVSVKAWLGGYEYYDVQDSTEQFEVKNGVSYHKTLFLDIPRDLNINGNYVLHIEAYDRSGYVENIYTVFVEAKRHDIEIQDVLISPSTKTAAGKAVAVQVRLENFGDRKEKDIKVEASIEKLGVSAVTYIDEIDSGETGKSDFMLLTIPEDASSGDYKVNIKVTYNKGHSEIVSTRFLQVAGGIQKREEAKESIVEVATKQELLVGSQSDYKIAIVNIGDSKKSYSVEVSDTEWATSSFAPEKLELAPGAAGGFVVSITPRHAGLYQFSITIKEDDKVLKEVTIGVNVKEGKEDKILSLKNIENINRYINMLTGGSEKNLLLLGIVGVLFAMLLVIISIGLGSRHYHHRF